MAVLIARHMAGRGGLLVGVGWSCWLVGASCWWLAGAAPGERARTDRGADGGVSCWLLGKQELPPSCWIAGLDRSGGPAAAAGWGLLAYPSCPSCTYMEAQDEVLAHIEHIDSGALSLILAFLDVPSLVSVGQTNQYFGREVNELEKCRIKCCITATRLRFPLMLWLCRARDTLRRRYANQQGWYPWTSTLWPQYSISLPHFPSLLAACAGDPVSVARSGRSTVLVPYSGRSRKKTKKRAKRQPAAASSTASSAASTSSTASTASTSSALTTIRDRARERQRLKEAMFGPSVSVP